MKQRIFYGYLLTAFLSCCCFHACLHEEGASVYSDKEERFFNTLGADKWPQRLATRLEQKNDSAEFVTGFVSRYGYPLWLHAHKFSENGNTVFAVPVRSLNPYAEINAIWFFTIYPDHTKYRIYTRAMAERLWQKLGGDGVEETWMFDYFTYHALHRRPKSNLWFEEAGTSPSLLSSSGGVEWHCVHAYAGYEGAEEDKGIHCWTTPIEEDEETETPPEGDDGGDGNGDLNIGDQGEGDHNSGDQGEEDDGSNDNQNPYPDDPLETDPTSPCGQAQRLSDNPALKQKVNELFNAVCNYHVGDLEDGWIKTATGAYIAPTTRTTGSIKYDASTLTGQKITEEYHSHPAGSCIPSFADLRVLATRCKNEQIDMENFSYGVISEMGCFTMVITSEEAFRKFTENILNDNQLANIYNQMLDKANTNGTNTAIAKFIDFLKTSVSGLDVLFREPSYNGNGDATLNNWQAKDSNGDASLSDYDCN